MKKGDIILCVDNNNSFDRNITIGKEYKLIEIDMSIRTLWIKDDLSEIAPYLNKRFSKVDRRRKIIDSL